MFWLWDEERDNFSNFKIISCNYSNVGYCPITFVLSRHDTSGLSNSLAGVWQSAFYSCFSVFY